jgi:hypothetical protein
MDHLTLETQRLRSLRAMHAGLIELKWLRDALRFDLAMRTHLFTLKYATRRAEIESYRDPPRSLEELQRRAWTPEAGYDKHHIVERNQIDRFSAEVINRPEKLVLIPRLKHQEINGWYSTPDPQFGGQSPREYLNGRSLAVQRAVGLEALRRAGVLKP